MRLLQQGTQQAEEPERWSVALSHITQKVLPLIAALIVDDAGKEQMPQPLICTDPTDKSPPDR